jgi:AraC-like DNA-binding protein
MLSMRTAFDRDGIEIADVTCRHGCGRGTAEEAEGHTLVFVRRGVFVRSAEGVETLLDPTAMYCMNAGEEQRYDHPGHGGDDCTALLLEPTLMASLWGGDPTLPSGSLASSPEIDLEHRLLLAGANHGADPHLVFEKAIGLIARVLEQSDSRRVASGRPSTVRARRALADATREALASDPGRPLPELARSLSASSHHLSRAFRSATGHTIARHRMRLRTRSALERLFGGERDLARMAADLGFADQSHLCRVLRAETGHTPAALRESLASTPLV